MMRRRLMVQFRRRREATDACIGAPTWGATLQGLRRRLIGFLARRRFRDRIPDSTRDAPLPRHGLYRVLVCRANHRLGNLLLLTPLIAELQVQFPGAQVDLIVGGDQSRDVFEHFPNVGMVYSLPRHALRHPWRTIKVLGNVSRQRYDLAIDPDISSHSSRLLVNRFRSTYRIGFTGNKPSERLSCGLPVPLRVRHMGQLPIALLRGAIATRDVSPAWATMPMLDLRLTPEERASGQLVLNGLLDEHEARRDQPVIGIFTHATGSKRYADEWWSEMLDCLRIKYPRARFVELLPAHGVSGLGGSVPGYFSSQPRRMAAVMAATRMFIAADSGIMHLACASRGPIVVGLFNCTDPEVYGPYGSGNQAISTHWLKPNEVCEKINADFAEESTKAVASTAGQWLPGFFEQRSADATMASLHSIPPGAEHLFGWHR